jgi:hypothetical protein
VVNTISAHWIPFIPVHVPGDNRAIQLRRAAMPSVVDGTPVRPATALLREGLDAASPYFTTRKKSPRPAPA